MFATRYHGMTAAVAPAAAFSCLHHRVQSLILQAHHLPHNAVLDLLHHSKPHSGTPPAVAVGIMSATRYAGKTAAVTAAAAFACLHHRIQILLLQTASQNRIIGHSACPAAAVFSSLHHTTPFLGYYDTQATHDCSPTRSNSN